jgi:enoyl-CoA hydratase
VEGAVNSFENPYASFEHLGVTVEDGIAVVRLGTGERSAVSEAFHNELERVFQELARDRAVAVVVLTGAGRMFCAGGDVSWMESVSADELDFSLGQGRRIIEGLLSLSQPVIAAVNGHAIGLGCTLALFCDITIVAEDAKVADPHVGLGLVAGDGGAIIWPLLVGLHRANRYLLTGDQMTGAEAVELGLMGEAAPRDEVLDDALALARRIAALPGPAVRGTKRSVIHAIALAVHQTLELSLEKERTSATSAEHSAAVAAFLERRRERRQAAERA